MAKTTDREAEARPVTAPKAEQPRTFWYVCQRTSNLRQGRTDIYTTGEDEDSGKPSILRCSKPLDASYTARKRTASGFKHPRAQFREIEEGEARARIAGGSKEVTLG